MKKRRKWLLLGLGVTLLLLFGLSQFYGYIMKDQWDERSAAKAAAKSRAGLIEITKAQKSVWDENSIYWVLTGKNQDNVDMMVWVRFTAKGKIAEDDTAVYAELVSNGTSEDKIRDIIRSEMPDITINRLLPGVYNGEYAWQLFYKNNDRYHYRFYRFADGSSIGDEFSLPNR
ncbi:cell wall elongation regulator TseB-like domain-containing protein [Paenibacillus wynnii]|uniref:cell wall elongation regulator TseB-like domain-containing protein n=1 Tax=Paenibacillus wynnii TaxID=268407 RepID=UPI0027D8923D|nr:DUF5590 domain-containing protein [Paenibacillus wynnii]